jgi:Mg2+-importing ATPase
LKSISKAEKLLSSVTTRVRVLRANQEVVLDRKEVVPGDVLVLTSSSFSSQFHFNFKNEI